MKPLADMISIEDRARHVLGSFDPLIFEGHDTRILDCRMLRHAPTIAGGFGGIDEFKEPDSEHENSARQSLMSSRRRNPEDKSRA